MILDERTILAQQILQKLSETGEEFVVLRNSEEIFETLGHDIDLGIMNLKSFHGAFAKIIHEMKLQFLCPLRRGNCPWFLVRDKTKQIILRIDLSEGLSYRGIKIVSEKTLKEKSTVKQTIPIASPVLQIIGILIKEICHGRKIEQKHKERIKKLYSGLGKERFLNDGTIFVGRKAAKLFFDLISAPGFYSDEGKDFSSIRGKILRHFLLKAPLKSSVSHVKWLKDQIIAFLKPPGMFITLLGPDGSGKSTLCSEIDSILKNQLFNQVRYYHGHPELLPRLSTIRNKLLKKKHTNQTSQDLAIPVKEKGTPHTAIKGSLYVIYYTLDYFLSRIVFRFHRARNDLIIFDRYFYDYSIQPMWKKVPKWFLKICAFFISKPDLFVFLIADPEIIFRRKPELSPKEIEKQQAEMKRLMSYLKPVITIDTAEEVGKNMIILTNALIDNYIKRGF